MTQTFISAPADSGNIETIDATDSENIRLRIRTDGRTDHYQWFYFRALGPVGPKRRYVIENAGQASYVPGWTGYRVCASYDLEHWFRIDTQYRDGGLFFQHQAAHGACHYAYFAAYPLERARAFSARLIAAGISHEPLGPSVDGEYLDLFRFGTPATGKKTIWVIARQHPGESMGSFWAEGFLERLAASGDAAVTALLDQATVNVVPLVNVDGVRRGHLRTNAAGTDLNRAWAAPDADTSPEVLAIRNRMDQTGCDLFLDVHGDEAIDDNFLDGAEGIPGWNETHAERFARFEDTLVALSPAFQKERGYPTPAPGEANLKIATNQIAQRFDCLAMTLEMPFKDARVLPDETVGWSPARCRDLARSCLDAMAQTVGYLRAE